MDKSSCTILIADDDKYIRDDLEDILKLAGYRVLSTANAKDTFAEIIRSRPELVLLDIKFPDCSDLSLLQKIKSEASETEVIILTSQSENIPQVVESIKLGAFDFVSKPFETTELLNRIEKALNLQRISKSHEYLVRELEEKQGLQQLVGESQVMRLTRETISRFAGADGCVLIKGETGTGKEVAARALHFLGRRRSLPFVSVNCASIPEALAESVLFGHRRGAFTGAVESAKGKFELAGEGTIFLDEVGDMPLAQQAALLRVLEYRSFTPVGESQERTCKARFILATNRDLRERVTKGEFRDDLYYRINVASITLPALRNRPEDIPTLAEYYSKRLCAEMGRAPIELNKDVIDTMTSYDWPGNVRELKNVLEGALMLISPDQKVMTLRDLPAEIVASNSKIGNIGDKDRRERNELVEALRQSAGNQTQAARILGVHRNTIRARIRYFGLPGVEPDDQ